MKSPLVLAVLTICHLALPASGAAQATTEVTLKVPVNLTQLGPDVAKVVVICTIRSNAITTGTVDGEVSKQIQVPVSGGQVVTTASLVFSFTGLDNPVGKSASIFCTLNGWSTLQQTWLLFTEAATNPSFKISRALLGDVNSSFVW